MTDRPTHSCPPLVTVERYVDSGRDRIVLRVAGCLYAYITPGDCYHLPNLGYALDELYRKRLAPLVWLAMGGRHDAKGAWTE